MKNPFQPGDQKVFETSVTPDKLATFESGEVHEVYSTFALGRDAEWASRLFVLEMRELDKDEEGVGKKLTVEHLSPAPLGALIRIVSTLVAVKDREVICSYEAFHGTRLLAKGIVEQQILTKSHFDAYITKLKANLS